MAISEALFLQLQAHLCNQNEMDLTGLLFANSFGAGSNVLAFNAVGDGVTDNQSSIQKGINALSAAGGGLLVFPAGVFVSSPLTMASRVHLMGAGFEATTLKLAPGANGDLLSASVGSISLGAAFGTGSTGGIEQFSIQNMTLDGNKANQTAGPSYPLRFYGFAFILHNIRIRNGFTGGVLIDWNGGANSPDFSTVNNLEAQLSNFSIHDCNGIGLEWGGPHDSQISQGTIYDTTSHNLHFAPNAAAMQVSQVHCYSSTHGNNAVACLVEAGTCTFNNCEAEGSDVAEVVFLANGLQWNGGRIFSASQPSSGIQLGQQAGNTPYPSMILQSAGLTTAVSLTNYNVNTTIDGCEGTNGSVWFANDGGGRIWAKVFNTTGKYTTGNRNASTEYDIDGFNLAANFTLATTGGLQLGAGVVISDGTLGWKKSSGVQSLANNNTIVDAHLGMVRVSSAANVTGIILNGGWYDGQTMWVVNEAAFTITFDVAGTSHIADGATSAIPALCSRLFIWDTSTSLWYRAA